jgi:hypothetical protein
VSAANEVGKGMGVRFKSQKKTFSTHSLEDGQKISRGSEQVGEAEGCNPRRYRAASHSYETFFDYLNNSFKKIRA